MKVINLKEPKFKLPHSDSIYIYLVPVIQIKFRLIILILKVKMDTHYMRLVKRC